MFKIKINKDKDLKKKTAWRLEVKDGARQQNNLMNKVSAEEFKSFGRSLQVVVGGLKILTDVP